MPRRKPTKLRNWLEQSRQSREQVEVLMDKPDDVSADPLHGSLGENMHRLRETIGQSADVMFRNLRLADNREACLIFVEGLTDPKKVETELLQPLADVNKAPDPPRFWTLKEIENRLKSPDNIQELTTLHEVVRTVIVDLAVVLLIDGEDEALGFHANERKDRAIEEPESESVIRGPHEGFNENLSTSLSLIRRRLRSPHLIVEMREIGDYTRTKVALCYIQNIIKADLVDEIHQRLDRIQTDSIIDSGYIEEFIEDAPFSPFPQIQDTERPDIVTSMLLEGRVVILCDGSPYAIGAPVTFWSFLQASEDYYQRYHIANLLRFLRYICLLIALYLPSMYVAITTFHQEMLPTKLLISIAAAREITPFPAVIEAFIMEITFEALREAGVRLPKAIGSAISIVGALVIGQAAVEAGIVSAPMVIVVSITGISSFVIPRYNFAIAIRMLRFGMILLAGTLGLFGVVVGSLLLLIHLSGLRSLGVPYLQPLAPYHRTNLKDIFTRAPHWAMRLRPVEASVQNTVRQTDAMRPAERIPKNKRES